MKRWISDGTPKIMGFRARDAAITGARTDSIPAGRK